MYINNRNISYFNSSILESKRGLKKKRINTSKIKNKYVKGQSEILGFDYQLKILIKSENKEVLEKQISLLTKSLSECSIQEEGYSFIYECVLQSEDIEEYNYDFLEDKEMAVVDYSLFIIDKFEEEKVIKFSNDITLILNNTEITPCVLELIPTMNLTDVTITGLGEDIYIKSLTKDKKIIIDGEKGLVLEEGMNKWKDYDSWSFPKLLPRENNININKASINAKLSYKARWI